MTEHHDQHTSGPGGTQPGADQAAPAPRRTRAHARRQVVAATIAGVVVIGAAGFGLSRTPLLAVDRIDVTGATRLDHDAVLAAAGLRTGKPMTSVDTDAAAVRLRLEPWVASADVTTDWPHVVKVSIVERRPLLVVPTTDGRWAEVGEGGVVVAVDQAPPSGLPVVIGVQASPNAGSRVDGKIADLVETASLLPDSLRPQVSQMEVGNDGIRLGVGRDLIVIVGDKKSLADKLMAAAAVLSQKDHKDMGTLDVRSPSLPIATPKASAQKSSGTSGSTTTTAKPSTSTTTAKHSSTSSTTTTTVRTTKTTSSPGTTAPAR